MRTPDYKSGSLAVDPSSKPKIWLTGVHSILDHTSEKSVSSFMDHLESWLDVFNRSPLAKRLQENLTVRQFFCTLKGMNGDHAANKKSTAKGFQKLKTETAVNDLGDTLLAAKSLIDLVLHLAAWNAKKIAEAGGPEAWDALSDLEKSEHDARLMKEIVAALGKEAYDVLSPEDRRTLDLFIWAGCCMHKDMNSLRGGNVAWREKKRGLIHVF